MDDLIKAKQETVAQVDELSKKEQLLSKKRHEVTIAQEAREEEYIAKNAKFKQYMEFISSIGEAVSINYISLSWEYREDDETNTKYPVKYYISYHMRKKYSYRDLISEEELLQAIETGEYKIKEKKDFTLGKTLLLNKIGIHKIEGNTQFCYGISDKRDIMITFSTTRLANYDFSSYSHPFYLWRDTHGRWYLRRYMKADHKEWAEVTQVTLEKCVKGKENMVAELL
jgi:hypothetical protein